MGLNWGSLAPCHRTVLLTQYCRDLRSAGCGPYVSLKIPLKKKIYWIKSWWWGIQISGQDEMERESLLHLLSLWIKWEFREKWAKIWIHMFMCSTAGNWLLLLTPFVEALGVVSELYHSWWALSWQAHKAPWKHRSGDKQAEPEIWAGILQWTPQGRALVGRKAFSGRMCF